MVHASCKGRLALISQVITVVILGIILIVFQTFSTTQQSSWAQSPDEFVQYARKVMEVVQGAGVKGSAVESQLTPYNIQVYSWTQGDCGTERKFATMACTKESERIEVFKDGEDAALRSFNGSIRALRSLEQFDLGAASQKGYSSHSSDLKTWADPPRTLLTQSIQAMASANAYFTCGPVNGRVDKFSLSAPEPTPDSLTPEQFKQITAQKEAEAARMDEEHKAAVESLAKNVVQALVTNGLCNMPSTSQQQQTCPAGPLTQDTTTMTTTSSSSFAQKESDLLVDTSSSNNGDKSFQYTTTSTGQIANTGADYESSSFSSSTGAVYPVSPQQPPTTTSSSSSSPPRKPILFDGRASENRELFKEKTFDKPPWKFTYKIVEGQGLVLENIRAADQVHFKSVSVPHFEMTFSNGLKKIVRFDTCDFRSGIEEKEEVEEKPQWAPDPESDDILTLRQVKVVRHTLSWQFEKVFDKETPRGTLTIDYNIVIRTDRSKCEFIGMTFGPNCFRFIPTVSFYWQAQPREGETPQTVESFKAYYRLDYGQVGIAIDKNEDNVVGAALVDTGRLELLENEKQFTGVVKGAATADTFDNIHNAHPGQTVFAPMCRFTIPLIGWLGTFPPFDCNHIHWRWGGTGVINKDYTILNWGITPNVDVMIDPFNDDPIPEEKRGEPYLVPGQTIEVAVVKEKGTEEDPDSPLSPQIVNNEKIADTKECGGTDIQPLPNPCLLVSADEPVRIWYAATSHNKNSDTFFRHGTYVIDLKGEYKIKTAFQNLRSDLELTKSNTMSAAALDESNINEILAHLNQALADEYWVTDGTLVPVQGEKVFAELSKTVELMQQIKENGQDPQTSQVMDAATAIVLRSIQHLVLNTMDAANEKLAELTVDAGNEKLAELSSNLPADDKSAVENLVKQNEALNSSLMYYAAAVGEADLANSPQIIDNFRLSWNNTTVGLGEVFSALGIAPPAAIPAPATATTTATTPTATATTNATVATITTNNGTTTTTTTPPPTAATTTPPITSTTTPSSSISAVTLHPDSVPQFFKCGETPDTGSPTLPGLDVQSSTNTAITDGDANTEILGKAIFDVTFSEPITNGPGPELRVYEIGNDPEPFSVALFSGDIMTQVIEYSAVASATGETDDCGFGVNVAEIDLSDFGLGEGGQSGNEEIIAITGIRVDNQGAEGCCTGADISDVSVLTTTEQVPPSTTTTMTTTTTPPPPPTTTPGTNATDTITTATDGTTNTTTTSTATPPTTTTPASTCTGTDLPSGLVAWWPAAGNADDFLGNNDGVLQNGASFSGNVGNQAFRLDGIDDYVQMPSMNIGNTFSIDFWVYPEGQSENYQHLISNHFASSDHFGALYLREGNLEYWQNSAAWFQQVPGSQTIQPNTWSHIALTYDGSVIRIYANGSELSSVTTTGNEHSETFNNALRIGSSDPHESSYLQGLIDDVGLYNRALSLSEIQALFEVGKCSPTAAGAATTSEEVVVEEDVPLLPEQQLGQQQQDDEADAEGGEEGGEGQLALAQCDPSYPNVCIPSPPPDLNCGDDGVPENFQILPRNPHGFDDEDNDGIGCESEQQPPASDTTEPSGGGGNDDDTEAESEPSDSGDEDEDEDDDTSED